MGTGPTEQPVAPTAEAMTIEERTMKDRVMISFFGLGSGCEKATFGASIELNRLAPQLSTAATAARHHG